MLYQELAATSATMSSVTHHPSLAIPIPLFLELKPDGDGKL